MLSLDYVLPIKSLSTDGDDALSAYLAELSKIVRVLVIDGSPEHIFDARTRRWRGLVTHLRPDPALHFANGKVDGVVSGLRAATADKVVIADEDVRYDAAALRRVGALLDRVDLVRPQNYFEPAPWHARWDTARTLLNRLTPAGDYPGTLAVRRLPWLVEQGYDGDVLFENLELIRTVTAHGGTTLNARDLYVRRLAPPTGHFLRQRVRQAYDSQAQPARLAAELSILPVAAGLLRRGAKGTAALAAGTAASMALAEVGRRRAGGRTVFPASASALAPMWLLERGLCSWLALGARVGFGGVRYAGARIRVAAHSDTELRRRAQARRHTH